MDTILGKLTFDEIMIYLIISGYVILILVGIIEYIVYLKDRNKMLDEQNPRRNGKITSSKK